MYRASAQLEGRDFMAIHQCMVFYYTLIAQPHRCMYASGFCVQIVLIYLYLVIPSIYILAWGGWRHIGIMYRMRLRPERAIGYAYGGAL